MDNIVYWVDFVSDVGFLVFMMILFAAMALAVRVIFSIKHFLNTKMNDDDWLLEHSRSASDDIYLERREKAKDKR